MSAAEKLSQAMLGYLREARELSKALRRSLEPCQSARTAVSSEVGAMDRRRPTLFEEAERLKHNCVASERLLLRFIREGTGVAAYMLADHDIQNDRVVTHISEPGLITLSNEPVPPSSGTRSSSCTSSGWRT